jgi:hypothetical protein
MWRGKSTSYVLRFLHVRVDVPMSAGMGWGASQASVFFNRIVGGGVQLGPLGTAATNRPLVPTPGDYDDG